MSVEPIPLKAPRPRDPAAGVAPDVLAAVDAALAANRTRAGALLPVLHAIQDRLGWLPPAVVGLVARELDLSRAEVHGVVSFYHHFRTHEPGRHIVRICRAEACQARGARALEAHAQRVLGIDFGQTSADGAITLEAVYCLGNCGCGPSVLVGVDELHARVTPDAFDAIVRAARAEAP